MKKLWLTLLTICLLLIALSIGAVSTQAGTFVEDDALEYYISGNEAILTQCMKTYVYNVTIQDKINGYPVTRIKTNAFENCYQLKHLDIPSSVKQFQDRAFYRCFALETISIPNSVTRIGKDAFLETALYEEPSNWDNGVLYIGLYLIEANETVGGKYAVNVGTTTIADGAFEDCADLAVVTIPNSVMNIGVDAFSGCTALTDVWYTGSQADRENISIDESNDDFINATWHYNTCQDQHSYDNACDSSCNQCEWTREVVDHVYDNGNDVDCNVCGDVRLFLYTITNDEITITGCSSSASGELVIPSKIGGYPVTEIYSAAFYDCDSLTSIVIPDSVTFIGASAFHDCDNLVSVTLPKGIAGIYMYTFYGCSSLSSITIPVGVTTIGEEAFARSGLTSVTIPNSVTSIEASAFAYCSNLTSVTIPDSVTSIGYSAFCKCNNLSAVHISDVKAWCEIDFVYDAEDMFENYCSSNPLYYAHHLYLNGDVVTDLEIPQGTTTINNCVFLGCELISITVPDSVTSIGDYAFSGCGGLISVSFGNGVTSIGRAAFECTGLVSVIIPNSVTSIGDWAFAGSGLTSITIPNSVTDIGDYTFQECTNLTSVIVEDGVKNIGYGLFFRCDSLTSIMIPDSVTTIGYETFWGCSNLSDVWYIGSHIDRKSISVDADNDCFTNATWHYNTCKGEHHFSDAACDAKCNRCDWIRETSVDHVYDNDCDLGCNACGDVRFLSYIVSNGEVTITDFDSSFSGALAIPSQIDGFPVTSIESGAFYFCRSLTSITIPHSVTTIGDEAFYYCDRMDDVWYTGSKEQRNAISIGYDNYDLTGATWHYNTCIGEHTYVSTCDKLCNRCDWTRTTTQLHSYKAATCTTPKTCKVCGATSGDALGHTYTNACDTKCNECGESRTIKHSYKAATCTAPKTCKVCGKTSGEKLAHDYETKTTKATLEKNGKVVKQCTVCDKVSSTKTIYYAKSFKLSTTSYTYNGKTKTPSVTVKDSKGNTLKKDTDYTVSYASGRKNAGTYKVTVKMKGNYTGTKTLTFKIKPIDVSKCELVLSKTTYTYNGKSKLPTVTVLNHKGTKLTDSSYTVTYAKGRKNVGTYKVTIKMKGNYSGTKTLTFKINPTKTSLSSLTAGSKKLTVKWSKKSTQVTGYQIQYSTSKKFTSAKTKTISSYKTTSATLKSLKAKTTYYVRVRTYKTVDGKKYYSDWSTYKYKKTK